MHFQAVIEKFSPFDTILNSSNPDGLNDGALALAFPLHTASPSNSSSRLHEISEDGEDGQIQVKKAESPSMETVSEGPTVESMNEPESPKHFDAPTITVSDEKTSVIPQSDTVGSKIVVSEEELSRSDIPKPDDETIAQSTPLSPITKDDTVHHEEDQPRYSSQSARLSSSDLFFPSLYDIKPKVRLGPRPSLDAKRRPNTSGSNSALNNKSVSTLPAGLRMLPKKAKQSNPTQDTVRLNSGTEEPTNDSLVVPPPPPIPGVSDITILTSRPTSRGSTKSLPASMTPEKKRLMKALELRKKHLAVAKTNLPEKLAAEKDGSGAASSTDAVSKEGKKSEDHLGPSGAGVRLDSGVGIQYKEKSQSEDTTAPSSGPQPDKGPSQSLQSNSASNELMASLRDSHPENTDLIEDPSSQTSTKRNSHPIAGSTGSALASGTRAGPNAALQDEEAESIGEEQSVLQSNSKENGDETLSLENNGSDPAGVSLRQKRLGVVDPIHIHVSTENSEGDYLSDDSFMDELQSAKVEEARSLSVSKSPATPIFSRGPSSNSGNSGTTRPASYVGSDRTERQLDPRPGLMSSSTSPDLHLSVSPVQKSQEAANVSRQRTVSSGISKRIQALTEKSYRTTPPGTAHPNGSTDGNSSLLTLGKPSLRSQSRASIVSSPQLSRGPSKKARNRSKSPEKAKVAHEAHQRQGRSESISVTARIVRDPPTQSSDLSGLPQNGSMGLYQSPLIINHERAGELVSSSMSPPSGSMRPPMSPQQQKINRTDVVSHISSEASSKDLPTTAQRTSESSWRNFAHGRRSGDFKSPPPTARSQSNSSLASDDRSQDGGVDANTGKKKSRTSRLFKRMSNSVASANIHRRRSLAAIMSPTASGMLEEEGSSSIREGIEPLVEEQMLGDNMAWAPVEVGDLNVQFPDTLLWKRRWVQIDATGNLTLGLSKANEVSFQPILWIK